MWYLDGIDRGMAAGDLDRWDIASPELKKVFQQLEWTPTELELCNESITEINKRRFNGPYKSPAESFGAKFYVRQLICDLTENPARAAEGVGKISLHLQGGPRAALLYPRLGGIRNNPDASRLVEPALTHFADAANQAMGRYVDSGVFEEFRAGFALSKAIVGMKPAGRFDLHKTLSQTMASYRDDSETHLFFPSVLAWETDSNKTTDGDIEYLETFNCELDGPDMLEYGASTAFYNAEPRIGWPLLKLRARKAEKILEADASTRRSVVRSLVLETQRKCHLSANRAWLAARFLKLHNGLHYLLGKHPYKALRVMFFNESRSQVTAAFRNTVQDVLRGVEWAKPDELPPAVKTKLIKILRAVRAELEKEQIN
jgi:hypothetical protein